MANDIAATGFIGVAFETTRGTYVAPTKYFPIASENLDYKQDTQWRKLIRGIADPLGAVNGNSHIEGAISMELLHDVLPYFLYASRQSITKTGAGPYTYVAVPQHGAQNVASANGKPSLSITVVRDGVSFGYVGCQVSSMKFTQINGVAMMEFAIVGMDEASQSVPTPTFSTVTPFGMGMWSIQVPTAAQVFDVDNFTLEVNDNLDPQYRLQSVRTPRFLKYGERAVTLTLERDFNDRTEYDAFKALTAQSITVVLTNGANTVTFVLPVAIKADYNITGLNNAGDIIRASIPYSGVYDTATSKSYGITVVTATESIT